jgi:hypothetical protein
MYLQVADCCYFLVAVLDGYSRLEFVTDNGSQFTAADFKALVRQYELQHIRIRTCHPESNGKIERFHRSTRDALAESELRNLSHARELIGTWVKRYNQEWLHASLQYLPLAEYYTRRPDVRSLGARRSGWSRARAHAGRRPAPLRALRAARGRSARAGRTPPRARHARRRTRAPLRRPYHAQDDQTDHRDEQAHGRRVPPSILPGPARGWRDGWRLPEEWTVPSPEA